MPVLNHTCTMSDMRLSGLSFGVVCRYRFPVFGADLEGDIRSGIDPVYVSTRDDAGKDSKEGITYARRNVARLQSVSDAIADVHSERPNISPDSGDGH